MIIWKTPSLNIVMVPYLCNYLCHGIIITFGTNVQQLLPNTALFYTFQHLYPFVLVQGGLQ